MTYQGPASFWANQVDAYIDNKRFVAPLTAAQKRQQRQALVTYHLRTSAEGKYPEYHVPKTKRLLFGLPSFEVTAAVGHDRIIMWRATGGRWNGEEAAAMYADLRASMVRAGGEKRFFRVVEDGDRKGYQSSAGKKAKKTESIVSWQLPPRTPQWMPLDFCIWHEIEKCVL